MQRQHQREHQRQHDRNTVLQKIRREHGIFRHRILSGTVQGAYDSCRRICFYESLREYFLYQGSINSAFLEAAAGSGNILGELWELYLKNESLNADTWEEIETMLQKYAEEHTAQAETEETG